MHSLVNIEIYIYHDKKEVTPSLIRRCRLIFYEEFHEVPDRSLL
jgi:hypothetical protein